METHDNTAMTPGEFTLEERKVLENQVLLQSEAHRLMEEEKDQAYEERNRVVALLARLLPSGIRKTDIPGWDAEWHGCVYITLPNGKQLSWNYHDDQSPMFEDLPPFEGEYDGHTTEEKHAAMNECIGQLDIEKDITRKGAATCKRLAEEARRRYAERDSRKEIVQSEHILKGAMHLGQPPVWLSETAQIGAEEKTAGLGVHTELGPRRPQVGEHWCYPDKLDEIYLITQDEYQRGDEDQVPVTLVAHPDSREIGKTGLADVSRLTVHVEDPLDTKKAEMGTKFDQDKPMFHLLDPTFIEDMAKVMTHGAQKYGEGNWELGIETNRLYSAAQRHLNAMHKGELKDPDTGLPHSAHVACNMMMYQVLTERQEASTE